MGTDNRQRMKRSLQRRCRMGCAFSLARFVIGLGLAGCDPKGHDGSHQSDGAAVDAPFVDERPTVDCGLNVKASLLDEMAAVNAAIEAGGNAGSQALEVPSIAERDSFAALVGQVLGGDEAAPCSLPPPYRLKRLAPTDGRVFRVVGEFDGSGKPAPSRHWGTYVAPSQPSVPARALVIEAPHPVSDKNTVQQATDLFLQSGAQYLLVAGAHRCTNTQNSGCSGSTTACGTSGPYRISDGAHAVAVPFFAVHAVISHNWPQLIFLQLHGNAQACPEALLSDGSGHWSDAGATATLAAALTARGIPVGRCGAEFPQSNCNLCGTENVEARFTAGATNPCVQNGASYGRLVHIEQRAALRETPDAGVGGYQTLIDAVLASFRPI